MITRRRVLLASLFAVAVVSLPDWAVGRQGSSPDTVHFRDRKNDYQVTTVRGEIRESPKGIEVLSAGKVTATISPEDIVRVEYSRLPGLSDTDRLKSNSLENKDARDAKDILATRTAYSDMIKSGGSDPKTRRFLDFREAMWAARVADSKMGPDFETEAKAAIDKLTLIARTANKSWEVWPASLTAARLQAEIGKHNDAASTLANLARTPDLPTPLKYQARLAELDVLLRSNRLAAEPVASELTADKAFPATGPLKEKLTIYQNILKAPPPKEGAKAPEIVAIEQIVAKTTDFSVRATAHNALGEYYLSNDRPRDAMWEFLWVETVFNQDREQVIKAVSRLGEVFDKLGDKDRAEAYAQKLPVVKGT